MNIHNRLSQLGLELPMTSNPGGNYLSVNTRDKIAYVAIQFPILNAEFLYQGVLGESISDEEGYQAMRLSALNVISQIESKIGFEFVEGLNHFDAYYCGVNTWDNAPKIVNGASDLFKDVLDSKGKHSRAIFGVAQLPRQFCCGLTASFTLHHPMSILEVPD